MKNILFLSVLVASFVFTSCIESAIDGNDADLTNNQIMNKLDIDDPAIWNTLCTQYITTPAETESSFNLKSIHEYPGGDKYYFALYEDLYPSEGDYDFNDVILRSKLGWGKSGGTHSGYVNTKLINRGGSLPAKVGLMFYEVSGNTYKRIPYSNITVNGVQLIDEPWSEDLTELGAEWNIDYSFESTSDNIWINYFIEVRDRKILTSGFAPVDVEEFTMPRLEYLSNNNLPWGLEVEAEDFAICNEKELFLNAYPLFQEWAETDGVKNKRWYESPDLTYSHY